MEIDNLADHILSWRLQLEEARAEIAEMRKNRWLLFSNNELNEIILNTCMMDQYGYVTEILEPAFTMKRDIDAEIDRRKAAK